MTILSIQQQISHLGEVIEVKGSYHFFQSFGKLKDNGFFWGGESLILLSLHFPLTSLNSLKFPLAKLE